MLFENQAKTGGFNFAPVTEENGPLAKYKVGETVHKVVRVMDCRYTDGQSFRIYSVEEDDRWFSIKGNFPYSLTLNSYYEITGTIAADKKRGMRSVAVTSCSSTLPSNKRGIITVLQTLHGLDMQAHKLYDIIGPNVLEMIIEDPLAVAAKVPGVGIKRAAGWQRELLARGANDRELQKLYKLGLSQTQAAKLVAEHGLKFCEEVRQNPYRLIGEVHGYSFAKCDKFALEEGRSVRDPLRLTEGLLFTMRSVEMRGHCTYPKKEFMQAAHSVLDVALTSRTAKQLLRSHQSGDIEEVQWGRKTYSISIDDLTNDIREWESQSHRSNETYRYLVDRIDDSLMDQALGTLRTRSRLICETVKGKEYVTPGKFFEAERIITSSLRDLMANERMRFSNLNQVIDDVLEEQRVTLEAKQMEAVLRICAAEGGAFILNGSAGCGKTFTLNIIMKVLEKLYKNREKPFNPCVLAPTGKAAKVAASVTHLPAHTIHMALGLVSSSEDEIQQSGKDLYNNCIVVDEFSMVDEALGATLLPPAADSQSKIGE